MAEPWLGSLRTANPQDGFELAIKLSRMAVKYIQPSDDVRRKVRDDYADDAAVLTAASHVVAIHFQTIAAANDYWRSSARS
jgi:hypothetical protein